MIELKNDIKDFDLHILDRTSDKRSTLSTDEIIHNTTTKFLPPHMKQHFLDCIRNTNPLTDVSQGLKKHDSLFGLAGEHRYLLSESQHNQTPTSLNFVPSSGSSPKLDSQTNEKQQKAIIVAAAVSGVIILIGLLLCCREVRRSKKVDKDDRPFLILSSSDLSGGMSMFGFLC